MRLDGDLLPHVICSRQTCNDGTGDNQVANVVVTCAGCNFGRMSNTIEELGLLDSRLRPRQESD